ncbi:MAG: outer membrane lipoprotein-sorting protein [Bacteroidales bacterium]|nr:outer membrane lipoprotein-sorting protein [Bacteroidales bacterium]
MSLLMILVFFSATNQIEAQIDDLKAREIVKKAHEITLGKTSKTVMSMQIIRPDWNRSVSMQSWSMGADFYIIYITAPARDKGQVFLKRENNMWNWMPNIGRMIKIPPSMMMSSWMGSDFNNDELMKESSLVKDYTHQFLAEEEVDGYACHQIELIPLPTAPVVWGKVLMWISTEKYFGLKTEFYDEDGELINIQTASKVKLFGDRELPSYMEMTPVKKEGHKTIMTIESAEYNVKSIDESMFSQQMMKRIRPE